MNLNSVGRARREIDPESQKSHTAAWRLIEYRDEGRANMRSPPRFSPLSMVRFPLLQPAIAGASRLVKGPTDLVDDFFD
jgi:hypothetical protein